MSNADSNINGLELVRIRSFKTPGNNGFTLLELIVVCALIAIMLSLSVPSFQATILNDPLKSVARKSIGLVRNVREMATRYNKPYLLHVDHLDNAMWFEPDDNKSDNEQSESPTDKWELPENVQITGLWVAGDKKSALENRVIWISSEGYLENTIINFEDEDGRSLAVEFQTFLDKAVLHDQVPSL